MRPKTSFGPRVSRQNRSEMSRNSSEWLNSGRLGPRKSCPRSHPSRRSPVCIGRSPTGRRPCSPASADCYIGPSTGPYNPNNLADTCYGPCFRSPTCLRPSKATRFQAISRGKALESSISSLHWHRRRSPPLRQACSKRLAPPRQHRQDPEFEPQSP